MFEELNRAAELDYRLFWKLERKVGKGLTLVQSSTCKVMYMTITMLRKASGNTFLNIFSNASFKDQVNKSQGQELRGYLKTNNSLSTTCSKPFTVQEVALVTKLLPKGKSPSHDGILYEHITRAKHPIDMALTSLYNSVL